MAQKASSPHSALDLSDGLHLVTRRIAEIGCAPYDAIIVEQSDARMPYVLQRHLDRHDVEVLLAASAVRVVPDKFWECIPNRAAIRRRRQMVLNLTKAGTLLAPTDRSVLRLVP